MVLSSALSAAQVTAHVEQGRPGAAPSVHEHSSATGAVEAAGDMLQQQAQELAMLRRSNAQLQQVGEPACL